MTTLFANPLSVLGTGEKNEELQNTFEMLGGNTEQIEEEANEEIAVNTDLNEQNITTFMENNPGVEREEAIKLIEKFNKGIDINDPLSSKVEENLPTFMENNPDVGEEEARIAVRDYLQQQQISPEDQSQFRDINTDAGIIQNVVGGAIANIPDMFANILAFGTDVIDTVNIFNDTDAELEARGEMSLSDKMREWGAETEADVQELLGVNPNDMSAKIGEGISEIVTLLVPGANVSLLGKLGNMVKITDKIKKAKGLSSFLDGKIGRYLYDVGGMAEFSAKFNILHKGEVDLSNALISGAAFPMLTRIFGQVIGGAKGIVAGLPKMMDALHKNITGFKPEYLNLVKEHPDLVKKMLEGIRKYKIEHPKITDEADIIRNALNKNINITKIKILGQNPQSSIKDFIKALTKAYDDIINEGVVAKGNLKELFPALEKRYTKLRETFGVDIGKFRTNDEIGVGGKLFVEFIRDLKRFTNIKKGGINSQEKAAINRIKTEMLNIFGKKNKEILTPDLERMSITELMKVLNFSKAKITQGDAVHFNKTLREAIFEAKVLGGAVKDTIEARTLSKFSKAFEKNLDKKLGKGYVEAKKIFSDNLNKLAASKKYLKESVLHKGSELKETTYKKLITLKPNSGEVGKIAKEMGIDKQVLSKEIKRIQDSKLAESTIKEIEKDFGKSTADIYKHNVDKSLLPELVRNRINKRTIETLRTKIGASELVEKLFDRNGNLLDIRHINIQNLFKLRRLIKNNKQLTVEDGKYLVKEINSSIAHVTYWQSLQQGGATGIIVGLKRMMSLGILKGVDSVTHRMIAVDKTLKAMKPGWEGFKDRIKQLGTKKFNFSKTEKELLEDGSNILRKEIKGINIKQILKDYKADGYVKDKEFLDYLRKEQLAMLIQKIFKVMYEQ